MPGGRDRQHSVGGNSADEFDLSELLGAVRAGGDIDVIRRSVEMVPQALIDAEATEVFGARPHERPPTRAH